MKVISIYRTNEVIYLTPKEVKKVKAVEII